MRLPENDTDREAAIPSWAADPAGLLSTIVADVARFSDPEIISRASMLSELAAAALMRDLRATKGIRSKDVDAFDGRVRKLRREREKADAVAAASARAASREPSWRDEIAYGDNGKPSACFNNACLFLEHLYADRLSYDIMAQRPYLDGLPLDDRSVSRVRRHLGSIENAHFGEEDMGKAIALVAFEMRAFHPVREYLKECREKWDGKPRLDDAATTLLNVPAADRLARLMFKRTIIAMVARGICPGEKVDTILILVGYQGAKKSSLFRTLGGAWFGDSKVDITDRKGQMVMASRWLYEWPEIDRVFRKHDNSDIKAFVSQESDEFVPMFGRSVISVARSWLAVGTTNHKRFLTDVTGDRRVWCIDLHRNGTRWKVKPEVVAAMRDQLFGEAVAEYEAFTKLRAEGVPGDQNPHRWWLDDAEEEERQGRTAEHRVENVWAETVAKWLAKEPIRCPACHGTGRGGNEGCSICRGFKTIKRTEDLPKAANGREYVTPRMVMEEALGIPPERHCAHGTRIADTLAELGWAQGSRMRVGGVKVTPYYSPAPNAEADAADQAAEVDAEERAAIQGEADGRILQ